MIAPTARRGEPVRLMSHGGDRRRKFAHQRAALRAGPSSTRGWTGPCAMASISRHSTRALIYHDGDTLSQSTSSYKRCSRNAPGGRRYMMDRQWKLSSNEEEHPRGLVMVPTIEESPGRCSRKSPWGIGSAR